MASNRSPFDQDLETRVAALRDGIVEQRAAVLAELVGLNQARLRGALREHDLAEAEGEKVSVDVLSSRVQQAASLTRVAERSRIPVVSALPEQAILHGRVIDVDGGGVEGRVVVVLDTRGREAARTTSAEIGYFKFVFPPTVSDKASSKEGANDEVQVRVEVRADCAAPATQPSGLITLARGKVVYRELSAP